MPRPNRAFIGGAVRYPGVRVSTGGGRVYAKPVGSGKKGGGRAAGKSGYRMGTMTPEQIMKHIKRMAAIKAGVSPETFYDYSIDVAKAAAAVALKVGGQYVRTKLAEQVNTSTGATEPGEPQVPMSETSASKIVKDNGVGLTAKRYTTKLVTGRKTSRSVSNYMANNGSKTKWLLDTTRDDEFQSALSGFRENLQLRAGFNQKLIYASPYIQANLEKIAELYKILPSDPTAVGIQSFNEFDTQTAYGIAKDLVETINFHNLNTYHALDLKIHLVASKQPKGSRNYTSTTVGTIMDSVTGNNSDEDFDYTNFLSRKYVIKQSGLYPQADGSFDATNADGARYCLLDPRASISSSPAFNAEHTVIHTVKRRLAPGDRLDFKNSVGLGPGLNLNDVFNRIKNYEAVRAIPIIDYERMPLAYQYLIEVVGQKTVGVVTETGDTFLGTSPFTVQMEASQKISLGLQNVRAADVSAGGGWINSRYAVKLFTNESDARLVSVLKNADYNSTAISVRTISDAIKVVAGSIVS